MRLAKLVRRAVPANARHQGLYGGRGQAAQEQAHDAIAEADTTANRGPCQNSTDDCGGEWVDAHSLLQFAVSVEQSHHLRLCNLFDTARRSVLNVLRQRC